MKHRAYFWPRLGLGACLAFLSASGLAGCEGSATQTTSTDRETTGKETRNDHSDGLHGSLVEVNGDVAAGVKVQAWPSAGASDSQPIVLNPVPAALTHTDSRGRYQLLGLEAGVYNIFAEKGEGASSVRIAGVRYKALKMDLGKDILNPPGIITGKVLAAGAPLIGGFCIIPGSALIAMTDSSGRFVLTRVPKGAYTVKYTAAGFVSVMDSLIVVNPQDTTPLPPKTLEPDLSLLPGF